MMRTRATSNRASAAAGNHALAVRSREPSAHKVAITRRASAASSARASMRRCYHSVTMKGLRTRERKRARVRDRAQAIVRG